MSVVSTDSKFLTILFSQPELNKRIGRIDTCITPAIHLVVAANVRALIFCLNLLSSDTLVSRVHAFMQAHKEHVALGHACVYMAVWGWGASKFLVWRRLWDTESSCDTEYFILIRCIISDAIPTLHRHPFSLCMNMYKLILTRKKGTPRAQHNVLYSAQMTDS